MGEPSAEHAKPGDAGKPRIECSDVELVMGQRTHVVVF
jgi:hypothetical protein